MVFLLKSTERKSEIACAARVIMISFVEQLSRFTVLNVHEDEVLNAGDSSTSENIWSYSSRFFPSKCLTMAARILLVRVTRGVLDDEVEGGLERMATIPLLPKVE